MVCSTWSAGIGAFDLKKSSSLVPEKVVLSGRISPTSHRSGNCHRASIGGGLATVDTPDGRNCSFLGVGCPPSHRTPPQKNRLIPTPEAPPRPEICWIWDVDRLSPFSLSIALAKASKREVFVPKPTC